MAWPQRGEYKEAVQNPQFCFQDPELQGGQPATNAQGRPMTWSGNVADVYQIRAASGRNWAVKCFASEKHGLGDRYREISAQLRRVKLPFMVDFEYLDQGIRVGGEWFPILKMRWVEGLALNEFVRDSLDMPNVLENVASIWVQLAHMLRRAGVAHGDIQHGNVLLVLSSKTSKLALKLIDYDGMFVPALAGRKPGEVGHLAYQHRERARDSIYSVEVDRFSHLAIYCALRCLLVGGRPLWDRYNNDENLLFRKEDFQEPEESPLFKELWEIDDPECRALVGRLFLAALASFRSVPLLDHLVADGRKPSLTIEEAELVSSFLSPGTSVVGEAPQLSPDVPLQLQFPAPALPTPAPGPSPTQLSRRQSFQHECSQCGRRETYQSERAGSIVYCISCGIGMLLPGSPPPPKPHVDVPLKKLIGGLLVLLVFSSLIFVVYSFSGDTPSETEERYAEIFKQVALRNTARNSWLGKHLQVEEIDVEPNFRPPIVVVIDGRISKEFTEQRLGPKGAEIQVTRRFGKGLVTDASGNVNTLVWITTGSEAFRVDLRGTDKAFRGFIPYWDVTLVDLASESFVNAATKRFHFGAGTSIKTVVAYIQDWDHSE